MFSTFPKRRKSCANKDATRPFCYQGVVGSMSLAKCALHNLLWGAKKYTLERVYVFLSKPQAWHIITARSAVYITNNGRAVVVSHHAPACIFLWLDDIQHFVLMIYNASHWWYTRLRRDYIESCVNALDFQGLFVFLGVKNTPLSPLHIFPDLLDLNLRLLHTFE